MVLESAGAAEELVDSKKCTASESPYLGQFRYSLKVGEGVLPGGTAHQFEFLCRPRSQRVVRLPAGCTVSSPRLTTWASGLSMTAALGLAARPWDCRRLERRAGLLPWQGLLHSGAGYFRAALMSAFASCPQLRPRNTA